MSQSELLGVSEAAELVGVSIATIKRAAIAGRLPVARKLPGATGAYLFRRADVEALRAERAA